MMAWVWPAETVRSTPRRISPGRSPSWPPGPAGAATLTCRSRISRVDINLSWVLAGRVRRQGNVDVIAVDLHRVGGNRSGRGRVGGVAGPQVETRPVQPAFHRVVVDLPLRQRNLLVRAHVVQRVHLALGAHHRDRHAADLHPDRPVLGNVRERAGPDEGHCLAHALSPARLRGAGGRRLPPSLVPRSLVQATPRPSGSLMLCPPLTPWPAPPRPSP